MQKETLQRETDQGLTSHQIAEKYNISVKTVHTLGDQFSVKLNIDYTDRLSSTQEEFLFGKILGDGYLSRPTGPNANSYLHIGHGRKQRDYVWDNYKYIKEFCNNPPQDCSQKRDPLIYKTDTLEKTILNTKCHKEFTRLRRYFYERDHKIINNDILSNITPLALAIWYSDDGSVEIDHRANKTTGIKLHTLQFCLEDNQKICKWFLETYNIFANPNKTQLGKNNQQQYSIRISKRSFETFTNIVRPYMSNCLMYKIELKV